MNNLLPGYDATGNNSEGGPNISNDDAHGTNSAGIAATSANNNIGVAGIAYNAKIIPVRVAYENSYPIGSPFRQWITQDSWLATGINYAYTTGQADILSDSWGGGSPSNTIDTAINSAVTVGRNGKGCVVLFAAGNNNSNSVNYPASNPNVIAVGASSNCDTRKSPTSCDGEYWWGSNYGTGLDIVAPGVKIYTTDLTGSHGFSSTDYNPTFNGTSSATPNAAGVAALILSLRPDYTGTQVRQILESTCDKIGGYTYQANVSGQPNGTWCSDVGYGRVNAYKAVFAATLSITGTSPVCTSGSTFTLNNPPANSTVNWTHSSNLTYISGQGTDNYTVRAASSSINGMGWVKAIVNSSSAIDTLTKDVWVGNPGQPITDPSGYPTYQMTLGQMKTIRVVSAPGNPYQYVWNITGSITKLSGGGTQCTVEATTTGLGNFYVNSINTCGTSVTGGGSVNVSSGGGGGILLSPNPVNNILTIEINNKNTPDNLNNINSKTSELRVYDKMMNLKMKKTFTGVKTEINVRNLKQGVYILQIISGNKNYTKEIMVSHH